MNTGLYLVQYSDCYLNSRPAFKWWCEYWTFEHCTSEYWTSKSLLIRCFSIQIPIVLLIVVYFDRVLGAGRQACWAHLKAKKSTEKRQFQGTPSGSRPALRSRQNQFFFRRFLLISAVKSLKSLEMNKKG